jgi:NADPH-dependent 2,4-dienoyl-CoA reductase/sulfur reductase-like enzyme
MINYKDNYDILIIGGGPGGMAAALKAHEIGIKNILLMERDNQLGGILPQCIHSGFGLKIFKKQLTGPEYAQIFMDKIHDSSIKIMLSTIALAVDNNKNVTVTNKELGIRKLSAKTIILSLGCRERTRGAISIPGSRPSGILTAGLVQRMVNIEGYLPGKEIVILGSGDIGLIMARRLTLEGLRVKGVYEVMPFSTGLPRNITQCLDDYDIPLYLNHTVTNVYGRKRLEAVRISKVDRNLKPVLSTGKTITCDTLLLSVGLICENELLKTCGIELDHRSGGPIVDESLQTSVAGIFACGNSLYINDLVDNVTEDGDLAAESAASYLRDGKGIESSINIVPGDNISYIIPQKISGKKDITFRIRPKFPVKNAIVEILEIGVREKKKVVGPGELLLLKVKSDCFKDLIISGRNFVKINITKNNGR